MELKPGLSAAIEMVVCDSDTAIALGSGAVPVLGTPRLLALFEEASIRALDGRLDDGTSTVGVRAQIEHIAPTGVDGVVTAEACLEKIEGRRLTFTTKARDAHGLVAAGKITRVVIDVERFMSKAR